MSNKLGHRWLPVTILILIDGFLQFSIKKNSRFIYERHNPYFNRWFSAIGVNTVEAKNVNTVTILILIDGFLQSS